MKKTPKALETNIACIKFNIACMKYCLGSYGGEVVKCSERRSKELLEENFTKTTSKSEVCSKLKCSICPDCRFTSLEMYDKHLLSKKHLRKKVRKDTASVWRCEACELTLPNNEEWVKHLSGQRHDKALVALSQKLIPRSELITPAEVALLDDSSWVEEET